MFKVLSSPSQNNAYLKNENLSAFLCPPGRTLAHQEKKDCFSSQFIAACTACDRPGNIVLQQTCLSPLDCSVTVLRFTSPCCQSARDSCREPAASLRPWPAVAAASHSSIPRVTSLLPECNKALSQAVAGDHVVVQATSNHNCLR